MLIAAVQVLVMSVWFSASAVIPSLRDAWGISSGEASWLTGAVQIGFVVGALASALLTLADRVPARILIAVCAAGAAGTNAAVALFAGGIELAVPLRFLTGVFLAGVYPVGMKLMASWFVRGRGLARLTGAVQIGFVVGALASALPTLADRVPARILIAVCAAPLAVSTPDPVLCAECGNVFGGGAEAGTVCPYCTGSLHPLPAARQALGGVPPDIDSSTGGAQ